jgi:glycosyltransferase involved in cell wall biosynthesis
MGAIRPDDTIVADGYYGLGLAGKVRRLIVVAHGIYSALLEAQDAHPPANYDVERPKYAAAAEYQRTAFHECDEVVAVSRQVQDELREYDDVVSDCILNGVDTTKYTPGSGGVGMVEVCGNNHKKGSPIVAAMRSRGFEISPLGFDGDKWQRWRRYETALLPSFYEGGQYAGLEAMAVNLKVIAYKTGIFKKDVPEDYFFATDVLSTDAFIDLSRSAAVSRPSREPREWVLENATMTLFAQKWRKKIQ